MWEVFVILSAYTFIQTLEDQLLLCYRLFMNHMTNDRVTFVLQTWKICSRTCMEPYVGIKLWQACASYGLPQHLPHVVRLEGRPCGLCTLSCPYLGFWFVRHQLYRVPSLFISWVSLCKVWLSQIFVFIFIFYAYVCIILLLDPC